MNSPLVGRVELQYTLLVVVSQHDPRQRQDTRRLSDSRRALPALSRQFELFSLFLRPLTHRDDDVRAVSIPSDDLQALNRLYVPHNVGQRFWPVLQVKAWVSRALAEPSARCSTPSRPCEGGDRVSRALREQR